ncbi:CREB-regulated transcription coactivator 2 [Bagarius yarrelli]|uniref:CREB-regulated transcription coactivator 2 n=1 Tax=Bagarius yarrelli TaxID=175774 RepID=A0A556TPN2_BAGYA|nr:CREB-regulated transcription coactivator 2 [Bagarius yarrelli]
MTGAAAGAAGRGQWSGSGAASLSCNPRKFSEKIALQIQRQAEDIAAFQEVMTDITSTRIQAQRVRQARSLASYYGGSLPNVSQISTCPSGNIDIAPYLSVHLSPPSGTSWRRSANEKSQMDQTPMTALSRTRSDSALHTSVRMTHTGDPNPEQLLIGCSQKAVPLIEENVLEEGRTPKLPKTPSDICGYDTPGNHISGSLPDLSSLCLPSAAPESSNPQPPINTNLISSSTGINLLPTSDTHEIPTDCDFPLPSLSSSLQALANNSLLQPSLSNPNLQATLSSPSLHDSLSSTSLCTSLSSSSLKSSFSSQSLRSSFSSSSLSNRSFQSASSCSHSSGIGASCSCSSSSLSCSPRTTGQVTVTRMTSSVGRSQHSPLIAPSGEEPIWQQQALSPTLSCIPQGVPLNSTKLQQEVKPPPYPYSQFSPTWTTKVHNSSQSWQHHQSDGWDQCRQNTRWYQQQGSKMISAQCKPQPHYMQQQSPQCQTQNSLLRLYHFAPQQQLDKQTLYAPQQYQQTESNYQSQQQPISCSQTQQYLQHQAQQFPSQHQQQLDQCWNPQLQYPNQTQNQLQYQNNDKMLQSQEPFHYPSVLEAQDEYTSWDNQLNQQQNCSNTQKSYMNIKKRPKLQSKKILQETERARAQSSKSVHSLTSSPDNEFRLHNISYVGLQLTLSQTEALSQKLGQLHKVTRNSDFNDQDVKGKHLWDVEHIRNSPTHSYSNDVSCSFPSAGCAASSVCLDDVISDLPFSVPELDLDSFILAD